MSLIVLGIPETTLLPKIRVVILNELIRITATIHLLFVII
jgi:hypothetical protein